MKRKSRELKERKKWYPSVIHSCVTIFIDIAFALCYQTDVVIWRSEERWFFEVVLFKEVKFPNYKLEKNFIHKHIASVIENNASYQIGSKIWLEVNFTFSFLPY